LPDRYDAIVIGGGHNGLVCAAYLARGGLKTCVLERRHIVGGAAVTEEVFPGFRWSVASYVMSLLQPRIIRELELERHGFKVLPASSLFVPFPNGDSFIYWDDERKTCAEIARFSKRDAEAYPVFNRYLQESASIVRQLLWETPPDPSSTRLKDMKNTAALIWKYRRAAGKMYRIADLLTQSVSDYLDRWFESPELKGVLAYYSSIGTFAGPRSPGTAYVLLHHLMGEHQGAGGWGFVRGGMGAITQAIAASAREKGAEIRTSAEIERILVRNGAASGVALKSGEEIEAKLLVSNANAKHTFLKLVDEAELPPEFLAEIRSYRTLSSAFKINLAVEEPPAYKAADPERLGNAYPSYVHLGHSIDYLEKAYDDAKYGRWSERPFVTPVVPTIVDDTLAPKGKHVVNLFGGHAPYHLKDARWEESKDAFFKTVVDTVSEFAPNFRDSIIHAQVLAPPDLEALIGLPNGHIFHGELAPDQLFFMRPAPHYADYRSPIRGLYQCGSSTHPGGGVMGVPGYNAAREILKDWKAERRR
jgi:phytoene dehydrogenase-like protein